MTKFLPISLLVLAAGAMQAQAALMVTYNLVQDATVGSTTSFHIDVTDNTAVTDSGLGLTGSPSNYGLSLMAFAIESSSHSLTFRWDTPKATYGSGNEFHGFDQYAGGPTSSYATLPGATLNSLSNNQNTVAYITYVFGYGTAAGGSFPTIDAVGDTLDVGTKTFGGSPIKIADGTFTTGDTITLLNAGAGVFGTNVWGNNPTAVNQDAGFQTTVIGGAPEPASLMLLSVGGLLVFRRRQRA